MRFLVLLTLPLLLMASVSFAGTKFCNSLFYLTGNFSDFYNNTQFFSGYVFKSGEASKSEIVEVLQLLQNSDRQWASQIIGIRYNRGQSLNNDRVYAELIMMDDDGMIKSHQLLKAVPDENLGPEERTINIGRLPKIKRSQILSVRYASPKRLDGVNTKLELFVLEDNQLVLHKIKSGIMDSGMAPPATREVVEDLPSQIDAADVLGIRYEHGSFLNNVDVVAELLVFQNSELSAIQVLKSDQGTRTKKIGRVEGVQRDRIVGLRYEGGRRLNNVDIIAEVLSLGLGGEVVAHPIQIEIGD